jgi:S1-C subfamily serine protease
MKSSSNSNAPANAKPSLWNSVNADRIAFFIVTALATPLVAQQSLESEYRTTGPAVTAVFEPQREVLQKSSAVVLDGRKEMSYGVVVSPDGCILTKASEIEALGNLSVTVDRVNYKEVKIVATDPQWDVALLKVDANGLVPVEYAATSDIPQGAWVVANGATSRTTRRALAGIVSAKIREIPAAGGPALGLVLNGTSKLIEIAAVTDGSGAQEAGLQKGDIIVSIEGGKISKIEDIAEALKDRKAGTKVKVVLRRGKQEITAEVRLAAKGEMFNDTMNRNDMMSGDYSRRRSGFPRVMQHDILGSSRVTGGPLLDLEGRCIGMNIARANRAESFAIPVEDLKEIAGRLMKQAASLPAGDGGG